MNNNEQVVTLLYYCTAEKLNVNKNPEVLADAKVTQRSDQLDFLLDHISIRPIGLDPARNGVQGAFEVGGVIPNQSTANHGLLVSILQIQFGNREIEFFVQVRHKRLDPPALFFERGAAREMEVDGQGGEHSQFPISDLRFWIRVGAINGNWL
jgi:hypothetical protein